MSPQAAKNNEKSPEIKKNLKEMEEELKAKINKACLDAQPFSTVGGVRYENSLAFTTIKFMSLREHTLGKTLNLTDAAEFLNVPKRRLYDITNVMEGIQMAEKTGRNSIRWLDHRNQNSEKVKQLKEELDELKKQEENIDGLIQDIQTLNKILISNPVEKCHLYIKASEIQEQTKKENLTSIVVQPIADNLSDIMIQVADAKKPNNYEILTRNKSKNPLNSFICLKDAESYASFAPSSSSEEKNVEKMEEDVSLQKSTEEDFVLPEMITLNKSSTFEPLQTPGRDVIIPMSPLRSLIGSSQSMLQSPNASQQCVVPLELPNYPMRPWNILNSPPKLLELFPEEQK